MKKLKISDLKKYSRYIKIYLLWANAANDINGDLVTPSHKAIFYRRALYLAKFCQYELGYRTDKPVDNTRPGAFKQ